MPDHRGEARQRPTPRARRDCGADHDGEDPLADVHGRHRNGPARPERAQGVRRPRPPRAGCAWVDSAQAADQDPRRNRPDQVPEDDRNEDLDTGHRRRLRRGWPCDAGGSESRSGWPAHRGGPPRRRMQRTASAATGG